MPFTIVSNSSSGLPRGPTAQYRMSILARLAQSPGLVASILYCTARRPLAPGHCTLSVPDALERPGVPDARRRARTVAEQPDDVCDLRLVVEIALQRVGRHGVFRQRAEDAGIFRAIPRHERGPRPARASCARRIPLHRCAAAIPSPAGGRNCSRGRELRERDYCRAVIRSGRRPSDLHARSRAFRWRFHCSWR